MQFDSGKPFRGIGENIGWESRSFEDSAYGYDSLLPAIARNGANFFRTWMCQWNLPLEWRTVANTRRYSNTQEYYNPGGIRRMDELLGIADSLGLYIMLTLDSGGSLWNPFWYDSSSERGSRIDPTAFFRSSAVRQKYKDKLRYVVARWGYSTSIAAFEFFNELDNMAYTPSPHDSVIIAHGAVTEWHSEMSRYLHDIDPYHHIITTSISHRDIIGLDELPYVDVNQKHIYDNTDALHSELLRYSSAYNKAFVIGEFAYEWNWNIDFSTITGGLEYDFKRGLWYGLFSPTPILPMSWWWEFFDSHGLTPYFRGVREVSDRMLEAGGGSFEKIDVRADVIESYGVRCGQTIFIYLLNNSSREKTSELRVSSAGKEDYSVLSFDPSTRLYTRLSPVKGGKNELVLRKVTLKPKHDLVLTLAPAGAGSRV
ncbi:MAG TPA: glycoside hydrolase, partial [Bacteroidota bacterium]|nr:glycoside hydrolase [Bacteroidota bacterium]